MAGKAFRWIGALVDPPMAELTTMAFSKAFRVMMSDGFRSSYHADDALAVVGHLAALAMGAGMAAEPGNCMPSASASEFIVVAVPMVLQ
jgi:hypothetical protein